MVNQDLIKSAENIYKWYLILNKLGSIYGFNLHDELRDTYNKTKLPIMPNYVATCNDCIISAINYVASWYLKNKPAEVVTAEVEPAPVMDAPAKRGRKPKG